MKCPTDGETLVMSDRNGVEIDYCPKCRGVWLDRGELDKIIERAGVAPAPQMQSAPQSAPPWGQRRDDGWHGGRDEHGHSRQRPYLKKRESFLGNLFDF
jgi:Zn-finger nucleic acid-binding protein